MVSYGKKLLFALTAIAIVAAGCGSSSRSTTPGTSGSGSSPTYTIGVITDLTGLAASAELSTPMGVKAGVGLANSEGYHLKYVVVDAGTSPTGALTAAKTLVEQDHVFAVIAVSAVTFAAAPYLLAHGVPVLGSASDSTEWIPDRNMFSVFGTEDYTKVESTYGQFFKAVGASNIASVGYSISPSSSESAKGAAISSQVAGLKVGYLNSDFPFGSTNVGPVALAMKSAGVDGFVGAIEENTSFALVEALHQEGVALKAALFAVGYGGDLTNGGAAAKLASQQAYFTLSYEPVEMHTAATGKLQNALKTYAGVSSDPTLNEYIGYVSVDAFLQGLKAAGPNPSQAQFINAMLGITDYNAAGLFGSHSIGFALNQRGLAAGADNCIWITQYSGSAFHLVAGMDPLCGTVVPGKTVSASS